MVYTDGYKHATHTKSSSLDVLLSNPLMSKKRFATNEHAPTISTVEISNKHHAHNGSRTDIAVARSDILCIYVVKVFD